MIFIVLPLLNVSRRLPDNSVNEKEPNQQTVFCTSAGNKISYSYDKLIDVFENAIIDPSNSFVMGCDYRVPVLHGLIDRNFINKLNKEGITIVMISHDVKEVFKYATHILHIGKELFYGTKDEYTKKDMMRW